MVLRKINSFQVLFQRNNIIHYAIVVLNFILFLFILISCQGPQNGQEQIIISSDYKEVTNTPDILVEKLSKRIRETSGLAEFDSLIWTINDSGGGNFIYALSKNTGKIKRKIGIKKAKNHDWEALASDKEFIYIADVGNNKGNRIDLKVYKVKKKSLEAGKEEAKSETIYFNYPDQKIFYRTKRRTRFDCEAIISFGDSLVLFTKDWFTNKTRMYSIPKEPGSYDAKYLDTFNANGLITGADLSKDGKKLVLCGYSNFDPFLWIFEDYEGKDFFAGKVTRVEYPSFRDAQTEGVLFIGNDSILVSSERSPSYSQRIYYFSHSKIMEESAK